MVNFRCVNMAQSILHPCSRFEVSKLFQSLDMKQILLKAREAEELSHLFDAVLPYSDKVHLHLSDLLTRMDVEPQWVPVQWATKNNVQR